MEQLESERKDAKLNESPMTIEKAKPWLIRILHLENETPEEEQRLQVFVETYNKQLESEQASIRREKESDKNNQNNGHVSTLIGRYYSYYFVVFRAYKKAS